MRKIFVLLCIMFFLGVIFSPSVVSSVKVSPGKLYINVEKGYPSDGINYSLKVTNNNNYDVSVTVHVWHPFELTSGYSRIADLSWLKISKDSFELSAKSYDWVEIKLDIPEDQKDTCYNEKWETWVVVIPKKSSDNSGVGFETQLAVPIFINNPEGVVSDSSSGSDNFFVVFGVFIFLIVGFFILNFFRIRRRRLAGSSKVFYFDKKKDK